MFYHSASRRGKRTLPAALAVALLGLGLQSVSPEASAAPINLPTPSCGVTGNCLVFDDFTVYSLGLLEWYKDNKAPLYATNNFIAKSNEANAFVLNFNGQGTTAQGTGTNIDNPYDSMTGNPSGPGSDADNLRFLMASKSLNSGGAANDIPSDPTGTGGWDNLAQAANVSNSNTFTSQFPAAKFSTSAACQTNINTPGCLPLWDAKISDLKTALNGSPLVGLFEFNETGNTGELVGQDLVAYAQVILHSTTSSAKRVFTFSGNGTLPFQQQAQEANKTDLLPTAGDKWARVHAEICVKKSTGEVFLGECADSPFPSGDRETINQALGANQADFAIFNKELNDIIYGKHADSAKYDVVTFDVRLAYLNDGGDRLWFGPATIPGENVPVPGTLALLGSTLLGFAAARRRIRT